VPFAATRSPVVVDVYIVHGNSLVPSDDDHACVATPHSTRQEIYTRVGEKDERRVHLDGAYIKERYIVGDVGSVLVLVCSYNHTVPVNRRRCLFCSLVESAARNYCTV